MDKYKNDGSFVPLVAGKTYDEVFYSELEEFCEFGTDSQQMYNSPTVEFRMVRGSEYSVPLVQGRGLGTVVSFPLHQFEFWTAKENPDILANLVLHRYIDKELRKVFFNPLNDLEYKDNLVDWRTIPVYAFTNGDGNPIPRALDGTEFNPSIHTHFMARRGFTPDNIRDLIVNVVEHGTIGEVKLYLHHNEADQLLEDSCEDENTRLKYTNPNFFGTIGIFDGITVDIARFVPPYKGLCLDTGLPRHKPLYCRRLPNWESVKYDDEKNVYRDYFGLGVKNRHMGAAIDFINDQYYTVSRNDIS